MTKVFPLLYWFGLLLVLTGIALRFWRGSTVPALALALFGVALLLAARLALAVRRRGSKP